MLLSGVLYATVRRMVSARSFHFSAECAKTYDNVLILMYKDKSLIGEFDITPWKENSLEQIWFLWKQENDESIFLLELFPAERT